MHTHSLTQGQTHGVCPALTGGAAEQHGRATGQWARASGTALQRCPGAVRPPRPQGAWGLRSHWQQRRGSRHPSDHAFQPLWLVPSHEEVVWSPLSTPHSRSFPAARGKILSSLLKRRPRRGFVNEQRRVNFNCGLRFPHLLSSLFSWHVCSERGTAAARAPRGWASRAPAACGGL